MRKPFLLATLLVSSMLSMSCQTIALPPGSTAAASNSVATDPALLQSLLNTPYPKVLLRAGDTVAIKVFGASQFDLTRRITNEGTISLPLIGEVPAAGFSLEELERAVAVKLASSGMVNDPQVAVTAISQPADVVNVSGDVVKPGLYPASGQLTLIDYLSLASGLNGVNFQGSSTVTLIRPSLGKPVTIPLGPDPKNLAYGRIPVFSGDEIRVGRTGVVYAVGAFRVQSSFPLKNTSPTTVMELVALAGGIGFEADYRDAHIVRDTDHGRVLVPVNVGKILKGKAADVNLEANDILFVPTNQMKAAIKGGGAGIIAGFATAYIYRF